MKHKEDRKKAFVEHFPTIKDFLIVDDFTELLEKSVQTETLYNIFNIFCFLLAKKVEGLLCTQFRGIITQPYFPYINFLKTQIPLSFELAIMLVPSKYFVTRILGFF